MSPGSDPHSPEFLRIQAEARYARERYQLYKARTYGPRPTDPARMRDLERSCELAEQRLRAAKAAAAPTT
jgi:hypothetical protein